ncbi:MAG: dTDP-4-dehydrorhamnose reductase [Pontibacterium sp.]
MTFENFSQPVKILVIGASGQVGTAVVQSAEVDAFFEVTGLDPKQLDITSPEKIREQLDHYLPDYVINCAGFNAVDAAQHESDRCYAVNTKGVDNLASACGDLSIPVVHISSDFVFDGHYDSGYREDDEVAPLGFYGDSKWQGEEALRRALPQHIILRVSWIFSELGDNYVTRTLEHARSQLEIRAVNDRLGCPTAAEDVARVVLAVLKQVHNGADAWGTYHYSGAEVTSRYSFCKEIITLAMGYEELSVERLTAVKARQYITEVQRPNSSILECKKLLNTFGIRQRPWRTDLTEVVRHYYHLRKQSADS